MQKKTVGFTATWEKVKLKTFYLAKKKGPFSCESAQQVSWLELNESKRVIVFPHSAHVSIHNLQNGKGQNHHPPENPEESRWDLWDCFQIWQKINESSVWEWFICALLGVFGQSSQLDHSLPWLQISGSVQTKSRWRVYRRGMNICTSYSSSAVYISTKLHALSTLLHFFFFFISIWRKVFFPLQNSFKNQMEAEDNNSNRTNGTTLTMMGFHDSEEVETKGASSSPSLAAPTAFVQEASSLISQQDVSRMLQLQEEMYVNPLPLSLPSQCFSYNRLQRSNETISSFNSFSSTTYEALTPRIEHSSKMIKEMKKDLDLIFRKLR